MCRILKYVRETYVFSRLFAFAGALICPHNPDEISEPHKKGAGVFFFQLNTLIQQLLNLSMAATDGSGPGPVPD